MGHIPKLQEVFELFAGETSVFDDGVEGVRIDSIMVRNGDAVDAVGHADVFALCNDSESDFREGPNRPLRGNVGEEQLRRGPLLRRQWSPSSPPRSSGDRC